MKKENQGGRQGQISWLVDSGPEFSPALADLFGKAYLESPNCPQEIPPDISQAAEMIGMTVHSSSEYYQRAVELTLQGVDVGGLIGDHLAELFKDPLQRHCHTLWLKELQAEEG